MRRIFEPVTIGNVTLKNRIVFAPASFGLESVYRYEQLAMGGCSMIIIADLSVVPSLMGAPGLYSMQDAKLFQQIIKVCHRHGCKVSAQLFHPEYDVRRIREMYRALADTEPQKVRQALRESVQNYCDVMEPEQIQTILTAFEAAARRAAEIGFDMIQIHGDRLAGSFTSPYFNHRKDIYQLFWEFPEKMVRAVRRGAPRLPLDYKLTVRMEDPDYGRGGISVDQIPEMVHRLELCGIDSFHVSLANHTQTDDTIPVAGHPQFSQEGCFAELALQVARCTDKPVCCVGKIQTSEAAEALCGRGIALIGMCRQLIADPAWPKKVEEGREDEVMHCLYCNQKCVGALKTGQSVGCVLHQEKEEESKG